MPLVSKEPSQGAADQEDTSALITAEFLREALGADSEILQFHTEPAVGRGENYLSALYRVCVQYRSHGAERSAEPATAHLIVKGLPAGEFARMFVEEMGVFQREAKVYEEALPSFYALADGAGPAFPRFSAATLPSSRRATLVLEDLRAQGFAMADRRARLDLAHCRLVACRLARLHALSLAYEQRHPGYLRMFADQHYIESNRERLQQFCPPFLRGLIDVTRTWSGFEKIADKLERLMDTAVDRTIEVCRPQEAGWNVLLHGDCWVNNILFKYGPDGAPEDLRLVDWQVSRRGSLALDLTHFLYSSPQDEVRAQHSDALLQEYCAELRRAAAAAGFGGETPSLQQLRREMERVLFFGFFISVACVAIVRSDPEDAPDMSELKAEDVESGDTNFFPVVQKSEAYGQTFRQLLPYFDKMGVLD